MQKETMMPPAAESDAPLSAKYVGFVRHAVETFSGSLSGSDFEKFIAATDEIGAKLNSLVDQSIAENMAKILAPKIVIDADTYMKNRAAFNGVFGAKPTPHSPLYGKKIPNSPAFGKYASGEGLLHASTEGKSTTAHVIEKMDIVEFEAESSGDAAPGTIQSEYETTPTWRTNGEYITKMAANMVGRELVGYYWDAVRRGFVSMKDRRESFAPLSDPADAYRVENELFMSVRYTAAGKDKSIRISVSSHCGKKTVVRTVRESDSALECRMELVTQLAAILAT